jgi:hypothetical protein
MLILNHSAKGYVLRGQAQRAGRVQRVLAPDSVEVDWFSGHSKGLKIEKESDLRLDPTSSSNLNPYRKGDLVKGRGGTEYTVVGTWGADEVHVTMAGWGKGIMTKMQATELSPRAATVDHLRFRAARTPREPVFTEPMTICPQCHAPNDNYPLSRLRELSRAENQPVGKVCSNCHQMVPFADWIRHNITS